MYKSEILSVPKYKYKRIIKIDEYEVISSQYKTGECLSKPVFRHALDRECEVSLDIYPNGSDTESENHVSLFVVLQRPSATPSPPTKTGSRVPERFVQCTFRILDQHGTPRKTVGFAGTSMGGTPSPDGRGLKQFVAKDELKGLLINGTLNLLMEATIWRSAKALRWRSSKIAYTTSLASEGAAKRKMKIDGDGVDQSGCSASAKARLSPSLFAAEVGEDDIDEPDFQGACTKGDSKSNPAGSAATSCDGCCSGLIKTPFVSEIADQFNSDETSDVTINIITEEGDDGKLRTLKLSLHRFMVSVASPVFQRMLSSDMLEGSTGEITIEDMSREIATDFFRFMYTGILPKYEEYRLYIEILSQAEKYQILALKKLAIQRLTAFLCRPNFAQLMDVAERYSALALTSAIVRFVMEYGKGKELVGSPEWEWLERTNPHAALMLTKNLSLSFMGE